MHCARTGVYKTRIALIARSYRPDIPRLPRPSFRSPVRPRPVSPSLKPMTIPGAAKPSSPPPPPPLLAQVSRVRVASGSAQCGRWNHRVSVPVESAKIPEVFPGRASAALSRRPVPLVDATID